MLSEIRFFLSLQGVLKAFRATWQSVMKNEIASLALAMTWFAEYLRIFFIALPVCVCACASTADRNSKQSNARGKESGYETQKNKRDCIFIFLFVAGF